MGYLDRKENSRLSSFNCANARIFESSFLLLLQLYVCMLSDYYQQAKTPHIPPPLFNKISPQSLRVQRHAEPARQRLIDRHRRRAPRRTQQHHIRHTHIPGVVPKSPTHRQRRPVVRERNDRRRGLRDGYPVVEVQGPGRFAVEARRDDEGEVELAQRGGSVGAVGAEGQDGAAFDVDGDLS